MKTIRKQCLLATSGAITLWASPAIAQETTPGTQAPATTESQPTDAERSVTFLDLTGSLGYSTNPLIRTVDSQSSFLGRASARAVHAWQGERSSTSLSGFVEGTTYFNNYGLESIFSLNGSTSYQTSETVTVYGSAGISGDLSGQLSNRFLTVPPGSEIPDPTVPPPPPTVENPDVFDFVGRSYHLYGQAGASIRTSTRSQVGLHAGVTRAMYSSSLLDEYTSIYGSGSYSLTLSERTTVGATLNVSRTEYDNSNDHSTTITPAATIHTQLSESWDLTGSAGVTFASVDRGLTSDSSANLSLQGAVCHTTESDRLCARVDRYSAASANTSLITTTSAGIDWYKKLDAVQTIQLSASFAHYEEEVLNLNRTTNHFRLAASYSRVINDRLSGGADLGVRSLHRTGIDPDTDITGTVFVRYRIGDLG